MANFLIFLGLERYVIHGSHHMPVFSEYICPNDNYFGVRYIIFRLKYSYRKQIEFFKLRIFKVFKR